MSHLTHLWTWPPSPHPRVGRAWDDGIHWSTQLVTPATELPVSVDRVARQWLRAAHTNVEDAQIDQMIRAATGAAEDQTQRAIMPQTWQMVLDGFPWGEIVLERPPLIAITAIDYYDGDGVLQSLTGSPQASYDVVPSGYYSKARLKPLPTGSWPTPRSQSEAVVITYTAGYTDEDHPVLRQIVTGIELMVGELYKQRSLSVHDVHNTPAVLNLERFWKRVW